MLPIAFARDRRARARGAPRVGRDHARRRALGLGRARLPPAGVAHRARARLPRRRRARGASAARGGSSPRATGIASTRSSASSAAPSCRSRSTRARRRCARACRATAASSTAARARDARARSPSWCGPRDRAGRRGRRAARGVARDPDPRLAEALDALTARIARPAIAGATEKAKTAATPRDRARAAIRSTSRGSPRVIGTTRSPAMVEQLDILLEHWRAGPALHAAVRRAAEAPAVPRQQHVPGVAPDVQAAPARTRIRGSSSCLPALDMHALLVAHLPHTNPARARARRRPSSSEPLRHGRRRDREEVREAVRRAWPTPRSRRSSRSRARRPTRRAPTQLVAEVLANPDDGAAREVLADHLLETDDVRGRFIALQRARTAGTLTPRAPPRRRRCSPRTARAGSASSRRRRAQPHFVDGFLAWCEIDTGHDGARRAARGQPSLGARCAGSISRNYAFPHARSRTR